MSVIILKPLTAVLKNIILSRIKLGLDVAVKSQARWSHQSQIALSNSDGHVKFTSKSDGMRN